MKPIIKSPKLDFWGSPRGAVRVADTAMLHRPTSFICRNADVFTEVAADSNSVTLPLMTNCYSRPGAQISRDDLAEAIQGRCLFEGEGPLVNRPYDCIERVVWDHYFPYLSAQTWPSNVRYCLLMYFGEAEVRNIMGVSYPTPYERIPVESRGHIPLSLREASCSELTAFFIRNEVKEDSEAIIADWFGADAVQPILVELMMTGEFASDELQRLFSLERVLQTAEELGIEIKSREEIEAALPPEELTDENRDAIARKLRMYIAGLRKGQTPHGLDGIIRQNSNLQRLHLVKKLLGRMSRKVIEIPEVLYSPVSMHLIIIGLQEGFLSSDDLNNANIDREKFLLKALGGGHRADDLVKWFPRALGVELFLKMSSRPSNQAPRVKQEESAGNPELIAKVNNELRQAFGEVGELEDVSDANKSRQDEVWSLINRATDDLAAQDFEGVERIATMLDPINAETAGMVRWWVSLMGQVNKCFEVKDIDGVEAIAALLEPVNPELAGIVREWIAEEDEEDSIFGMYYLK